jgi:hypothetical protein
VRLEAVRLKAAATNFVDAAKLDFVTREKRILLVAFSRKTEDVRGSAREYFFASADSNQL